MSAGPNYGQPPAGAGQAAGVSSQGAPGSSLSLTPRPARSGALVLRPRGWMVPLRYWLVLPRVPWRSLAPRPAPSRAAAIQALPPADPPVELNERELIGARILAGISAVLLVISFIERPHIPFYQEYAIIRWFVDLGAEAWGGLAIIVVVIFVVAAVLSGGAAVIPMLQGLGIGIAAVTVGTVLGLFLLVKLMVIGSWWAGRGVRQLWRHNSWRFSR